MKAFEDETDLGGGLGSEDLLLPGGGQALGEPLLESGVGGAIEQCHTQEHSEYDGKVVRWGATHFQETAADCCNACGNDPDCNVWVFCPLEGGCGPSRKHKECWLKKNPVRSIIEAEGTGHLGVPWTSGAIYSREEKKRVLDVERRRGLKDDVELPMVFMDVAIKGVFVGRMKFVLFKQQAPRSAENFRMLCTGEKGVVPQGHEGAGTKYHFKGNAFYRIIDRFIDQAGANTESVFGGHFKDDEGGLLLRHDRKGLLSMANAGPDTNTSHFSILMAPAPHLDGHYTIFGEMVEGWEVAEKINALATGKTDNMAGPEEGAIIVDSGQIR
ncbi:MAG: hypothetical protein WDW36_002102 [Sanguina aurantia]